MSDDYYDYDPGTPYEPPPRRRRRRDDYKRESEYDDAWAAADDVADDFEDLGAGDLAAGYYWQDRRDYGPDDPDPRTAAPLDPTQPPRAPGGYRPSPRTRARDAANLGPLPPEVDRMRHRRANSPLYRPPHPREDPRNRSYHRDRARRGEYGEYHEPRPAKPKRTPAPGQRYSGALAGIPFWQILLVVVLSVMAFLAVALACLSVVALF